MPIMVFVIYILQATKYEFGMTDDGVGSPVICSGKV